MSPISYRRGVSRRRAERLVNLVLALLSTRRFLTAEQISRTVVGYEHNASDEKAHEAFQRMFERDKAELRELGIPVETGTSSVFDTEPGYRIAPGEYALPEIELEPDEAAAVGLAARLWQHAGLAEAASSGLRKLRASGVEFSDANPLGVEPVISAEPALEPLLAAVRERCEVRFDYLRPGDDVPAPRRLWPWGVTSTRGRWYVVGYDVDRSDRRSFRLSRISTEVRTAGPAGAFEIPHDVDLSASAWGGEPGDEYRLATLQVAPGQAVGLCRWAESIAVKDDTQIVTMRYYDLRRMASRLVAQGPAVVVLDPPELRDEVIIRLKALAAGR